jgi:hypothetical protein
VNRNERTYKLLNRIVPDLLFVVMLSVLILPVWQLPFFPTLDAPGHVYNGVILRDLLSGQSGNYNDVFELNANWSPNWLSQLLLAGLTAFFSPVDCERIMHSIYIVSFAFGFRYLVRAFMGLTNYFALLGFVFIYNYTFILGFLNFNLSIAILLWSIGLLHRLVNDPKLWRFVLLALLLIVLFSCHLVGIVAFFVYAAIWLIIVAFQQLKSKRFLLHFKRLWFPLIVSFVPSAALLLVYLMSDQESGVFQSIPAEEITNMWAKQAGLWCFHDAEIGFTRWNYYVSGAGVLITILALLFRKKLSGIFLKPNQWWLPASCWSLFAVVILTLALIIPDASSGGGGMLTIRLIYISGMFLFLAVMTAIRLRGMIAAAACVLMVVTVDKVNYVFGKQAEKQYYISQITEASNHVGQSGVLVFLDFRGGWPLGHYAKVLAAEHRLIALDNLGAHKPFSPVQWNDHLRKNDAQLCWVGDQWNCDPANLNASLLQGDIYILKWGDYHERDSGIATRERWEAFFQTNCERIHDDGMGIQLYRSTVSMRSETKGFR